MAGTGGCLRLPPGINRKSYAGFRRDIGKILGS
jgi:hypothetical protein